MNLKTAARLRVCALLSLLGPILLPAVLSAQAPIRGFPQDALAQRARLEAVLRETPDTARLRASMRRMAAEPHHAGSPASRAVAEWARLIFDVAESGRSGAAWGLALSWHREGGIAGF